MFLSLTLNKRSFFLFFLSLSRDVDDPSRRSFIHHHNFLLYCSTLAGGFAGKKVTKCEKTVDSLMIVVTCCSFITIRGEKNDRTRLYFSPEWRLSFLGALQYTSTVSALVGCNWISLTAPRAIKSQGGGGRYDDRDELSILLLFLLLVYTQDVTGSTSPSKKSVPVVKFYEGESSNHALRIGTNRKSKMRA